MATTQRNRPKWYTDEDDSAWSRIKAAFRRDWEQTKHDFGGNVPDMDQDVDDTVEQAAGSQPIPPGHAKTIESNSSDTYNDADEPAYRYGYAASRHFGDREWDPETETMLRSDWGDESNWTARSNAVRRGWRYGKTHNG